MSDLPAPMTPADCDLREYAWMPLHGQKLFGSVFNDIATDAEFRTALRLWWAAWQECPTGSLPADDAALARRADFGKDIKSWLKVKARALHGFVLCSDGRLYHPLLCEEAVQSYEAKLKKDEKRAKDRVRLKAWRDARVAATTDTPSSDDGNTNEGGAVPADETAIETPAETPPETRFVAGIQYNTTPDLLGSKKESRELRSLPRARRATMFEDWYQAYPKKVGKDHAERAYAAAVRRGASDSELAEGLQRHRFSSEKQFIPNPATWLNQGRWKDDPDAFTPLRPAPIEELTGSAMWAAIAERTKGSRA